jgi:SAM-dependent methyltransferase
MAASACPLCGAPPSDPCVVSSGDRLHGVPGTFCVAVCSNCGCGWTEPAAAPAELGSFYPRSYPAYVLQRGALGALQRAGQRWILDRAFAHEPLRHLAERDPGDVLDVGCGRGDLGAALVGRGWRVAGIDPSKDACGVARARGVDARVGTLDANPFRDLTFDAVVMNHSLEHVPDPADDLRRVHALVRPGGLFVLSVPNFASWQRRMFGSSWFPLELPRHRTHFTPAALCHVLADAGFEHVEVRPSSDAMTLVMTLQYATAGRLVLVKPPLSWTTYALAALVAPVNRTVDRLKRDGAFLHGVARRSSHPPVP